jgi:MOSC domain-containing protein YiiM
VTARIFQLAISPGGVPKQAVREAVVGELGLAGDAHNDAADHGGPMRAVSLYALELITALQAEGHPIWPGATGENVTLVGLDWAQLSTGTQLALGDEVIVELTECAPPCRSIMAAFSDLKFSRISEKVHPGWSRYYSKVIRGGTLRVAQPVTIIPR